MSNQAKKDVQNNLLKAVNESIDKGRQIQTLLEELDVDKPIYKQFKRELLFDIKEALNYKASLLEEMR